jgi:hypothetical protein
MFTAYTFLAVLYTLTNQLVFFAISHGGPFNYELFKSCTPFVVMVIAHVFTNAQSHGLAWSTVVLQSGCMVMLTTNTCPDTTRLVKNTSLDAPLIFVLCFAVLNTSVCSIINESLFKDDTVDMNLQNAWLYFSGFLCNWCLYAWFAQNDRNFFESYTATIWPALIVTINSLYGVVIAIVYKYCGVVSKTFGSSMALCLLQYISWAFFGASSDIYSVVATVMVGTVSFQYFVYVPRLTSLSHTSSTPPAPRVSRIQQCLRFT